MTFQVIQRPSKPVPFDPCFRVEGERYLADLVYEYQRLVTRREGALNGTMVRAPDGRLCKVGEGIEAEATGTTDHSARFAKAIQPPPHDRLVAENVALLLGWRVVRFIAPVHIRKVHREIADATDRVSAADEALEVMSEMFALAVRLGWRSDNPCDCVRPFLPKTWKRGLIRA